MLDPMSSEANPTAAALGGELGVRVTRPSPEVAVLSVRGEVDSLTMPQLEVGVTELLALPSAGHVIDLSQVSFLASGGLAVLIRAAQLTEELGHRLRLVVTTRAVRRPLQLTGSDQLFDLFENLDTATGSV